MATISTTELIVAASAVAIIIFAISMHASMKSKLKNQTDKTNNLEAAIKDVQDLCASIEQEKNKKEEELNKCYIEINSIKDEERKIRIQLHDLTNDINKVAMEKKHADNLYSQASTELFELRNKFLPLEYRVNEIKKFEDEIKNLQDKLNDLNQIKKETSEYYATKKVIYDNLSKEVEVLENKLEMYSFGLYEPHFNYDTSEKYKEEMNNSYQERLALVKSDEAVKCYTEWTINGDKAAGRRQTRHYTKMMLRAFNGECDAAIAKVKWNNMQTIELRILTSFNAINKLGESHNILIKQEYRDIRVKELRLAYEYQEKVHEEREEQRRIREQIREEERALREMEIARAEAEKEEERFSRALLKARKDLNSKYGIEKEELLYKIAQLEENLKKAEELKQRAISMAQITKSGYVYVISNIGSFGENVYKIGMTRRLEPTDRIRELSGASVPFSFDIHAMIYSKNAPELESNFHKKFKTNRVNWVNGRKEFFQISLDDIEQAALELEHQIEFTKLAEARDYRETRALLEKYKKTGETVEFEEKFPDQLFDEELDDATIDERSSEDID